MAVEFFAPESFRRIPHGWNGLHFQSLILTKPIYGGEWPNRGAAYSGEEAIIDYSNVEVYTYWRMRSPRGCCNGHFGMSPRC